MRRRKKILIVGGSLLAIISGAILAIETYHFAAPPAQRSAAPTVDQTNCHSYGLSNGVVCRDRNIVAMQRPPAERVEAQASQRQSAEAQRVREEAQREAALAAQLRADQRRIAERQRERDVVQKRAADEKARPNAAPRPSAASTIATTIEPRSPEDAQTLCRERLLAKGVYLVAGDQCIDLDELIKKLATGVYHFNKPDFAYVEEPFRLVLALTTTGEQDVSHAFRGTPGGVTERLAPYAQNLEATLRGGLDFRITPQDAQQRTVTSNSPVIWEWTVVPLKPGKKTLVINIAANLIIGARKEHVTLRTLYEEIQISVGLLYWVASTFSGLWGTALSLATMIIAILGVIHYLPTRRKTRHQNRDQGPPVELVTHRTAHSDSSEVH